MATKEKTKSGKKSKVKASTESNGKASPKKPAAKKQSRSKQPSLPLGNGTAPEESLLAIRDAEAALEAAESRYEDARVLAREAKAEKEKLRKKLHQIIQEETGLEPTLWQHRNGTPAERKSKAAVKDAAESNATATDDEVRKTPLASLGLAKGIVEKLGGAGITTLGDYYDYTKVNDQGWGKRITDIPGIGQAAVDKIEAAVLEYVEELAKERQKKAADVVHTVADATDANKAAKPDAKPDAKPAEESLVEKGRRHLEGDKSDDKKA